MKNIDKEKLHEIFDNLKKGISYGKDCENCDYPYFDSCLYIDEEGKYIHWSHYGASAENISLPNLLWIIEVIFKMSPAEFVGEYIPEHESKYNNEW